jgi:hypothetical protein
MSTDVIRPAELERIETRLIGDFCPPLQPDEVRRSVAASVAMFQSGSVLNYVSILVEREAEDRLRALVVNGTTPTATHSRVAPTTQSKEMQSHVAR